MKPTTLFISIFLFLTSIITIAFTLPTSTNLFIFIVISILILILPVFLLFLLNKINSKKTFQTNNNIPSTLHNTENISQNKDINNSETSNISNFINTVTPILLTTPIIENISQNKEQTSQNENIKDSESTEFPSPTNNMPNLFNTVAPLLLAAPIIDTIAQNEEPNTSNTLASASPNDSAHHDNLENEQSQKSDTHKYVQLKKSLSNLTYKQNPRQYWTIQ